LWIVSMALGWETCKLPQLLGFGTLLSGVLLCNRAVRIPRLFEYEADPAVPAAVSAPRRMPWLPQSLLNVALRMQGRMYELMPGAGRAVAAAAAAAIVAVAAARGPAPR
jgi:hypothetical protein